MLPLTQGDLGPDRRVFLPHSLVTIGSILIYSKLAPNAVHLFSSFENIRAGTSKLFDIEPYQFHMFVKAKDITIITSFKFTSNCFHTFVSLPHLNKEGFELYPIPNIQEPFCLWYIELQNLFPATFPLQHFHILAAPLTKSLSSDGGNRLVLGLGIYFTFLFAMFYCLSQYFLCHIRQYLPFYTSLPIYW